MENTIKLFIETLHQSLIDGESYELSLTRKGDSMDVVLIPKLSDDSSSVPDDAQAVRAALAMPLAMNGMTLYELSSNFVERISGYGEARKPAHSAYHELLASLSDATASAKNKNSTKKTTPKTKPASKDAEKTVENQDTPKPDAPVSAGGVLDF